MRGIKYIDIGLVLTKHEEGKLYNVSRETSKEYALMDIMDILLSGSRKDKAEYFVAWCGLKYQRMTIVNTLYKLGYTYRDGANKRDLRVGDYRGRFTQGKCFYLQIKTGAKSFVTLQAVETVIGLKKPCETVEELKNALKLYHFTRDQFLKGVKRSETRVLYSAPSISRTMYNRKNKKWNFAEIDLKRKHYNTVPLNVVVERYCRPCVHGGYNAMSIDAVKYQGAGIVLDANRLYPYISTVATLPSTELIEFGDGCPPVKFLRHKESYYTIMKVCVSAALKDDGIPSVYPDGGVFNNTDPLTKMVKRDLTLTEADRHLLYENYKLSYFVIKSYMIFRASNTDFYQYMTDTYNKSQTDDDIKHQFYKLMGNGLIGTFAKNVYTEEYYLEEDNGYMTLKKRPVPEERRKKEVLKVSGLCYVNAAITSEARRYIVGFIKKAGERWLYTDTDSIHLKGTEIPDGFPISDKMGDFKIEHTFTKCRYYGLKKYFLVEGGKVVPTVAGLPKDTLEHIDKCKGIDTEYLKKAYKHQDIDKLTKKPIGIYNIVEDIGTQTIEYEIHKGWLCEEQLSKKERRQQEERKRREGFEWYTSKGIDEELYKRYGREKRFDHFIGKWNRAVDDGVVKKPTFDQAVNYLRSKIKVHS